VLIPTARDASVNSPLLQRDPGSGERIARFEVKGELGHGGMANVLEVVDTTSGARLALKIMLPNRMNSDCVERFEREFDTLSRISHPNVLKVIERGRAGDRPYYTMEYLRGRELKEVVESWKEISPQERFRRAEKILVQIAKALEHIHRRGLVHRDVTPSNIFVLDDGTAKLMDFGVVRDPSADSAAQEELVGTVAYMAPEQITSARVDARADLYSLGAVLYLMLTGRRPFNSRTLAGYLEKHLHQAVKPPRTIHPTLPEKLDRICMSLLEKNPDERISSATHLLRLLEGEPHAKGALGDLPLVGRARELSQIREVVGGLLAGHGAVVVLEGGAGQGKARMATELVRQAERAGIVVHRASNAAPDQRAFEGYRPIYRELRTAPLQPVLEATFGAGVPSGDVYDRRVVLEEMRKLAATAGRRLVVVDNLDLADPATIDLTEYLARNLIGVDKAPFVLVLTRQTPSDGASDPLASLLDGSSTGVTPVRITLGPISVSAVEELLLSVVQDAPRVRPLAERLQAEGSGNPYVITEMVETLVQEGLLIPGPGGELGHLAPGAFEAAQALPVPRTIRELWRARVAPVSSADLQVLRTLAASPEPLDLDLIAAGSALDRPEIERGLDELLERGLARLHDGPDEEHYELGLARLRDVLLEDADDDVLAAIHQRLGAHLERRHRKNPGAALEVMAFHFERARVPAKAYQYLLSSAERQLSRGYRREALALLDRALAIEGAARISLLLEDADRLLAEGLLSRARALHHLGRWEEAEATAAKAEATALELGHDWLLSKVLAVRSEILRFTRGSDVARELAREALDKAKHASDPKLEVEPLFDLGGLAWERGDLEHARQYWLEGLAKAQSLSLEALVARGYGGLGVVAICRGQLAEARRYLEQAYETCDRLGLVEALAVTGCNLVELHHFS
jgi:tetratricopeptide (TPR) repeat protein